MVALGWEMSFGYTAIELHSLISVGIMGFWSGSKILWWCLGLVDKVAVIALTGFKGRVAVSVLKCRVLWCGELIIISLGL